MTEELYEEKRQERQEFDSQEFDSRDSRDFKSYCLLDDEGNISGGRFDLTPQQMRSFLKEMRKSDTNGVRRSCNDDWSEFHDQLEAILKTIEQQ